MGRPVGRSPGWNRCSLEAPLREKTRTAVLLLLAAALLLAPGESLSATIGYWRMEVDDDPSPSGLSVANEVSFGTPLVSSEAVLDGSNLPTTVVPLTTEPNDWSIAAAFQGSSNGINASAAWYAELAVTSISIEYWARTQENTATPFRFTSGGLDGIVITNPNSLQVTWHVDVGGTPTPFTLSALDNMDTSWSHYAFVYDEVSGEASFYVDGQVAGSFDGPDNSPLVLVPNTPIEVGVLMDYASAGQGTLDELRIDGSSLAPTGFLVPEPGSGTLLALGLIALGLRHRKARGS